MAVAGSVMPKTIVQRPCLTPQLACVIIANMYATPVADVSVPT